MSRRRKKSLHFGLEFQDPYEGGRNIVFHNEHRSKRGRNKLNKSSSPVFLMYKRKKNEKIEEYY